MEKIPMTAAGYTALEAELKHCQQVERPRIIQQITEARTHGDLSENAEYHAAKEQQSLNEGRIAELEDKLARADVIDVSKLSGDSIKFGATVTLVDEDTDEKKVWQIVGEPEADAKKGRISITSPLAKALIGKTKGAQIEVNAPGGAKGYEIKKVEEGGVAASGPGPASAAPARARRFDGYEKFAATCLSCPMPVGLVSALVPGTLFRRVTGHHFFKHLLRLSRFIAASVAGHRSPTIIFFHRHHGRVLGIAQRERGLHVAHIGRGGELLDEGLEGLQIRRDAFEHEVDLAREHPAFAHQRLRAHELLESGKIGFRLARQMHHGEHRHLVAELLLVEQRAVALDVAGLLQRAHAAQAGRRRNADPARQLDIGHAAVVLQLFQNLAVDGIESGGQAPLRG